MESLESNLGAPFDLPFHAPGAPAVHGTAFDTSAAVRLRSPLSTCLSGSCPDFSATFTTVAFDADQQLIANLEGVAPSLVQLRIAVWTAILVTQNSSQT
jgi:hypothetical protein